MSETTRFWWVRHAPVESGGRIYGNRDMPADCSDGAPFDCLARVLPEGALWVTSHLRRTHETAAAIRARRNGRDDAALPLAEPLLGEQNFGDWQGLTYAELEQARGETLSPFWLAPAHERPPSGESFVELMRRVTSAVERLASEYAGRDIVAVAHGGTIRAALGLALALDPERALSFAVDTCSLTRIDHILLPGGGAWRVAGVNLKPHNPA